MAPHAKDPAHWLYRLTADEWLSAAETELHLCEAALARRAFRPGVTHARRAAGMAWNAVLALDPDERYGRSYMEHVAALATLEGVPDEIRAAARDLRDTPPASPALITLGKPNMQPAESARRLVDYARQRTITTN